MLLVTDNLFEKNQEKLWDSTVFFLEKFSDKFSETVQLHQKNYSVLCVSLRTFQVTFGRLLLHKTNINCQRRNGRWIESKRKKLVCLIMHKRES